MSTFANRTSTTTPSSSSVSDLPTLLRRLWSHQDVRKYGKRTAQIVGAYGVYMVFLQDTHFNTKDKHKRLSAHPLHGIVVGTAASYLVIDNFVTSLGGTLLYYLIRWLSNRV